MNLSKIYWSKEDLPNDLFILLQNLSSSNKLKIRELYDKHYEKPLKINKKNKKQLLIDKNKARIDDKIFQKDREIINNFKNSKSLDFINWIDSCNSEKGKEELKLEALKKFVKNNKEINKIEILIQLKGDLIEDKSHKKFYQKYFNKIKELNLKRIQLKFLGNKLPPLDFYNNNEFKLENWQIEVINLIKSKQSVLVCAPTSSGKTILSTYFSSCQYKILYLVPSKPLAYQVLAIFHKIVDEKLGIFVNDFSYLHEEAQFIVGTPYDIELKLPYLNFKPDLVVYDEIHNLNYEQGDSYQRLIKLLDYNFLALSATIPNSSDVINWWKDIHPKTKIKYIYYKNRFINIQRYLWKNDNKIEKLHPLSCVNKDKIKNGEIVELNLPLTPWDCYTLWDSLKIYDKELYDKLDPEIYFKDILRITLTDSKKYEESIKQELVGMSSDKLEKLLEKYIIIEDEVKETFDIFKLSEELKLKGMIPSIIFNNNSTVCLDMFNQLMEELEKNERKRYPYHYINLEYKHKIYTSFLEKKKKYEENNNLEEKEKKEDKFIEKELENYKKLITERYRNQLNKINKENLPDKDLVKKYLKINYDKDINVKMIEEPDIFEKHPDFIFNKVPMKANKIRSLRKEIIKKLGITINYTNNLIQGLKRGIGIYTKGLPDVYLRIVQELAQNKELGIVFSDDSLALGINMPFKTVIIAGWKNSNTFDSILYHQMIGRAGRRGFDTEGNLVFVNLKWKNLITSQMDKIEGINLPIPKNYNVIKLIENKFSIDNLKKNDLSGVKPNLIDNNYSIYNYNNYNYNLIWKLLKYDDISLLVIDLLNKLEMEIKDGDITKKIEDKILIKIIGIIYRNKNIIEISEVKDEFIEMVYQLISLNKYQVYNLEKKYRIITTITLIGDICKKIFNIIVSENIAYNIKLVFYNLFNRCKTIILKYLELS